MRNLRFVLALGLLVLTLRAAEDPFIGTWKMNVEKSGDNLGINPPKSQTRTYRAGPNGSYEVTTETMNRDGNTTSSTVKVVIGEEREVTAATKSSALAKSFGGYTHFKVRRLDERRREVTYLRDGKPIVTGIMEVSADGKTMTTVAEGTTPDGRKGKITTVFEKQ